MMNWKGAGRQRLQPDQSTNTQLVGGTEKKTQKDIPHTGQPLSATPP